MSDHSPPMTNKAVLMSETARTLRAVIVAALVTLTAVAGVAVFLGFPLSGSVIAGVVSGILAGGLLWGASRRAATFHDPVDEGGRDD